MKLKFVFYLVIGLLIGVILTTSYFLNKSDGVLVINKSDPNVDNYSFLLNVPFSVLDRRKHIYLTTRIQK